MKKLIIGLSLCVVSSASMADANMCIGNAGSGTAPANTGAGYFVQTTFTPKCSANTKVHFLQGTNSAAVGSVSTKGNLIFGGHTNGGTVASTGGCAASGCVFGDAVTAATDKLADSSS